MVTNNFVHKPTSSPNMALKVDATYAIGQTVSTQLVDRFRSSADNYTGRDDVTFLEITSVEVCFIQA